MKPIPEELRDDPGWRGALYILEHAFAGHEGVWSFVDPVEESIDFEGMLNAVAWSHSERLFLIVAHSLFNGEAKVDLMELFSTLDDANAEIVLEAMRAF